MLHIHHGNRVELLADHLLDALMRAPGGPLRPRRVVVPNPGTGRWLQQRLAGRAGIAANLELPLPAAFFWQLLRIWLPDAPVSPFDRETLAWRILDRLPALLQERSAQPLARYLEQGEPELRRFQLARRIADLFDQYLVYRPDQVLAWEAGEERHWQAELWRAVSAEAPFHRARLLQQLIEAMATPPPEGALSEPVFFFGLDALPPVYLQLLRRLAEHCNVQFYRFDPSEEYWADLADERHRARAEPAVATCLDLGNPLLASWGYMGQAFLDQLLELDGQWHAHFQPPARNGLLAQVQRQIHALEDGRDAPTPWPDEAWPSIQVHGVHTLQREIQVLHDNLLRCFEEQPDLEPRQVLVLAPDLAPYVPFIEAVFGSVPPERFLPWSLADRPLGAGRPLGEAIRLLLRLPTVRFTAGEVLALLEVPALQARLELPAEALDTLRRWIAEAGIRWGLDAEHRQELGLPTGEGLHSWRFGLARLFLGYATPLEEEPPLFGGSVPYLDLEGPQLVWLGALQTLLERLAQWRRQAGRSRTARQWRDALLPLLDALFIPMEEGDDALLLALRERLDQLCEQAAAADCETPVPLAALAELLEPGLEQAGAGHGFLQGGITFSHLQPMRALPFRVIALLGMNHDRFPRGRRPMEFDLMAAQPRRGDRDPRRDDRYLFLQCLLSAREQLMISYLARDPRSDEPRQPSPLVSELLDYLRRSHQGEPPAHRPLEVRHPLQPFSPRLFRNRPPLFTYDDRWQVARERAPDPFVAGSLPEAEIVPVELETLLTFWKHPPGALLQQRLEMQPPREQILPEDHEPFALDDLARWQLRRRLLEAQLRERSMDAIEARLRGEGRLPPGAAGRCELEQARARVAPLLEAIHGAGRSPGEMRPLDLVLGPFHLTGQLGPCDGEGVVDWRVGRLRGSDALALWIRHLAWCASQGPGRALFLAEEARLVLPPLEPASARAHLQSLLELRQAGLRRPLSFFPDPAWLWLQKQKNWQRALEKELDDERTRLAFRGLDFSMEAFVSLAEEVLGPPACAQGATS